MAVHALARLAVDGGDSDSFLDFRHVAGLAGFALRVVAVQPFEIGHLLGEGAGFAAARAYRLCLEGVAAAAKGGGADVVGGGGHEAGGGGLHDASVACINDKGAILGAVVLVCGGGNGDVSAEGLRSAEAGRLDLMADGAGDAVG